MPRLTKNYLKIKSETAQKLLKLLEKAIENDHADMGNIQIFDPETQTLQIIVQKGFTEEFLDHFKEVKPFDTSACGRAIGIGSPVIISDIEADIHLFPNSDIARQTGYRAVKSIPIMGDNNERLGVISTHFRNKKWNWNLNSLNDICLELKKIMEALSKELGKAEG